MSNAGQPNAGPGPAPWAMGTTSSGPGPAPWDQTEPNADPIHALVRNAPGLKDAANPYEGFLAGLQLSASGLTMHGKPNLQIPQNYGFFTGLAAAAGQGIGDLPFNLLGFAGGGAAGAAVPVAGETGVGEAGGAYFGSTALPQAVRETMMDYYADKDHPEMTSGDFVKQVALSAWNTTKAGVVGLVGGVAGGKAAALGSGPWARTGLNVAGFSAAATGTQAALDGRMPDKKDFVINAIAAAVPAVGGHYLGARASETIQPNLEQNYRQTGIPPWDQVRMAKTDPTLNDELVTQDVNGNPNLAKFNQLRPEEIEGPEKAKTPEEIAAHVEELLPQIRTLEGSGDEAISPKGAVGRYQIMPGTARQYGFDPSKLIDPKYNEMVARHVLGDLSQRFHGDTEAVLVAYNAGPGRAMTFVRDGRDTAELPLETQKYLIRAGFGGKGGEPPEPPKPPAEEPKDAEGKPDFSKFTDEMLKSRFGDAIGEQEVSRGTSFKDLGRQYFSELAPAKRIDETLIREGLLDPNNKQDLNTEDMFRQTYASGDRFEAFLHEGPRDAITFNRTEGPAFDEVVKTLHDIGGNWEDYKRYQLAQRTIEKSGQGIDTGIFKGGAEEARANVDNLKAKADYERVSAVQRKVEEGFLTYFKDSGMTDDARMKAMQDANMHYMSMRRVIGDDEAFKTGAIKGRNFKASNPIRAMEGSDRQIVDPLAATLDNWRQMIRMADRNRAIGSVLGSQETRKIFGLKQIADRSVKPMLAEPGSDIFKPYQMTPEQEKAFAPFAVLANGGATTGNRFTFFRNGKPEVWEAKDQSVAQLMRGADRGEQDWLSNLASFAAKVQRSGIVASPDFGIRVIGRHSLTTWAVDPVHPPPYITILRGLTDTIKESPRYWDAMARGSGSGFMQDIDAAMRSLDSQMLMDKTGALTKAWNAVQHPLQWSQMVTEKLATSARIGYMQRAESQGYSPNKAATMARVAFIDQVEKPTGAVAQWMARQVPFFQPAIRGTAYVGRYAFGTPMRTLRTISALVLPQIALYALNKKADETLPEEQQYSSLPQWERDNYYITPPINGTRLKLQRAFVLGPLLNTPVERLLGSVYEHDPHAWDSVIPMMAKDMVPSLIPQFIRPEVEQWTNTNFFTGEPLVSDHLKQATSDLQYVQNTSELAKKISALLGGHRGLGVAEVSPVVIDNYVNEYLGTVGTTVLHALDAPMGKYEVPTRDWGDHFFIRGFTARNPGMSTAAVDNFYKDAEKFSQLHADVMLEKRQGDIDQAQTDYSEVGRKAYMIVKFEKAMGIQRTAIDALEKRDDMNVDEKRQLSERIYNDAWQIARMGSRVLRGETVGDAEGAALSERAEADVTAAVGQQ